MAEQDIIQNMIRQLGQSQDERLPAELDVHFADADERTTADLLRFVKQFASKVNFYSDNIAAPTGQDWSKFFPFDENEIAEWLSRSVKSKEAKTAPHLALLLSFLGLYKQSQKVLNRFTGRHLDFYYRDVLRLKKKPAVPDRAHVLLELKKHSAPISIAAPDIFTAGKDAAGVEILYAPTGETVLNTSQVDSVRSLFVDRRGHGDVLCAPVANSSDGLGGKLPKDEPRWYGFGHGSLPPAETERGYRDLPRAPVGFALASPVLRLREGERTVTVRLTLGNVNLAVLTSAKMADAFQVYVTGEKNWVGPLPVSTTLDPNGVMQLNFTVPATEKAVRDYDSAIHGGFYTTQFPVLQVLLSPDNARIGYLDFRGVTLRKARLSVDVQGVTSLRLENDGGTLDPKKPVTPFGPQGTRDSRFFVGCEEALSKKLTSLALTLHWKDAPKHFSTLYSDYGLGNITNHDFRAHAFLPGDAKVVLLFDADNAQQKCRIELPATATPTAQPDSDFIRIRLDDDFLHATYRRKTVENALTFSKNLNPTAKPIILKEPYTPTLQSLSLDYVAASDEVDLTSTDPSALAGADVELFHAAYFGQMREHAARRAPLDFLADKNVSLLHAYENAGELLIGLTNLKAGDSVSVLFQAAEGTADPDLPPELVTWSVLCDNYWKPLGAEGVVRDTTNQLLTSGIIQFVLPAEATTQNTVLPAGRVWLRAGVATNVGAVCQLLEVSANAVEVRYTGQDTAHLSNALPTGKIAKLKNGLAAVKSVKQPYASFGGAREETDSHFYRRVSERLRHKDRCLTAWDHERIVLEAFPKVHKVKCIPHASETSWLSPGHVLLVVVPDLKNRNAMNPLQPKVDADTVRRITDFVRARVGGQVQIKVRNPAYQKIQLDFKVKFEPGYEFNSYSRQLKQRLIEFLSPWAFAADRDIAFGGTVYKSVLLDFVEDLDFVDYLTDFKMYCYSGTSPKHDVGEARPPTPDAILVSDDTHLIAEVT